VTVAQDRDTKIIQKGGEGGGEKKEKSDRSPEVMEKRKKGLRGKEGVEPAGKETVKGRNPGSKLNRKLEKVRKKGIDKCRSKFALKQGNCGKGQREGNEKGTRSISGDRRKRDRKTGEERLGFGGNPTFKSK